jgi:hypothetical protein
MRPGSYRNIPEKKKLPRNNQSSVAGQHFLTMQAIRYYLFIRYPVSNTS